MRLTLRRACLLALLEVLPALGYADQPDPAKLALIEPRMQRFVGPLPQLT
jgi:hypothetical protein